MSFQFREVHRKADLAAETKIFRLVELQNGYKSFIYFIKVNLNPRTDWYVPVEWISAHILIFESIKLLQPFYFN